MPAWRCCALRVQGPGAAHCLGPPHLPWRILAVEIFKMQHSETLLVGVICDNLSSVNLPINQLAETGVVT